MSLVPAALVVAALVSGCAHQIVVNSEPPGARIWVDGKDVGTAPVVIERTTVTQGNMTLRAQLDSFETTERVVAQDECNPGPAALAVVPFLALPLVVLVPIGPFITCGWACLTSPTLISLAYLQKYPSTLTVKLRPKFGAGVVQPTDGWTIPDDLAPNPPPVAPAPPEPARVPLPPQPEGANPVP
jgi:hypothetical protein